MCMDRAANRMEPRMIATIPATTQAQRSSDLRMACSLIAISAHRPARDEEEEINAQPTDHEESDRDQGNGDGSLRPAFERSLEPFEFLRVIGIIMPRYGICR